jgi:glucose dehydrogenase
MPFARRSSLSLLLLACLAGCGTIGLKKDRPATPTVGNRTPILSRISSELRPDPTLAGVSVIVPPAQANADWPQAGGSATKAMGHLALGATPTRAWTAQIAGDGNARRLAAAPVVGNGTLFVVDTEGAVQAFDAQTGAKRWTHALDVTKDLRPSNFGGGATFADGKVYATSGAGDVVALNAADGSEIWRTHPSGPLRGAPTVAFNSLYVMSQDNQIFALSLADG